MTNRHLTKALNLGKVGNIEESLKSYAIMDAVNDGENYYSVKEIIPVTALPVGSEDEIEIYLTSSDFHVIQLHDTFMTLNLKVTISGDTLLSKLGSEFQTEAPGAGMIFDNQFMFVGVKSGSNLIREYSIIHKGKTISSTLQNGGTIESFLMNLYKPRSEKNNRKHIHSLYESVYNYDTSACGTYVPLVNIKTGVPITIDMPVSIPIDDLVALQGFREYPSALFGELKLKFRINPNALVYCSVDPIASATKALIQRYHTLGTTDKDNAREQMINLKRNFDSYTSGAGLLHTRNFTQIGDRSIQLQLYNQMGEKGIVGKEGQPTTMMPSEYNGYTLNVQSMSVQRCTISIAGYRATKPCLENLYQHFQTHPFVVPAQRVEVKVMGSGPTPSGFQQCQTNIPLNHVSDFILLFPKNSKQITCFENPMYQDLQLTVGNRNFPERPVTTCGDPQFFQLMLNASDLDSLFECTDEYENSLTTPRGTKDYILNPHTDVTSFAVTLQAERSGGQGIYFDGITSNGENVSIELRGTPIHRDASDAYCYPRLRPTDTKTQNTQAPLLCTLQDTFWIFSAQDGGTCEYIRDYTAEQALKDRGYISVKATE